MRRASPERRSALLLALALAGLLRVRPSACLTLTRARSGLPH